jgi:hypothetical protein
MFGTKIWKLGVAFPLQKTPKLLPDFLFWRCTTVEPIIDRRERNPDEFCQSGTETSPIHADIFAAVSEGCGFQ